MRRAAKQIAVCAVLLMVFCVVCRLAFFPTYTAYIPLGQRAEETLRLNGAQAVADRPDVAGVGKAEIQPGFLRLPIRADGRGDVAIEIRSGNGEPQAYHFLRVGPFHTVYDLQTGGFTGDTAILMAVSLFWLLVSLIMMWHYHQAKGPAYYAYSTIYFAGFSMFSLVSGVLMLQITVSHIVDPARHNMIMVYETINGASRHFMMLTMPLTVVFAVAMAVSNIALLRHERSPRLPNVLGLLVGILLIGGEALGWYLFSRDFMGSEWEGRIDNTFQNVYATVFAYFECMLAGSVICGVKAANRRPSPDKDFIVILGCWFRKDGTLPPLLRGRVDRAVAFWRKQKETTGKEAILIPSGGRGQDEPMPEAEAMRRYLLDKQIPDRLIRPECQSANTYQNMAFSKKIIDSINPNGKTVFATTNYHVFRSGVWAVENGLYAEGIGGKTQWWYWPNAFMRECVGLMKKRWKQEILLLILMIIFFVLLSLVLG